MHPAPSSSAERLAPQSDRLLRMKEVQKIVGLSRSTIYALLAEGKFPRARRLTPATVAWRYSELLAWIDSRPAADSGERPQ